MLQLGEKTRGNEHVIFRLCSCIVFIVGIRYGVDVVTRNTVIGDRAFPTDEPNNVNSDRFIIIIK